MSASCATSQRDAEPSIVCATSSAAFRSISATITFFAPDRCAASQRARPMPLAPPVTTTVLPETCMDCRATVDCFTKQLQAFSELPEPPQEHEDTARRHWEGG